MYKSIFERVKNYSSNPIVEFNKIDSFLQKSNYSTYLPLSAVLDDAYQYCKELRVVYPSLRECIEMNCTTIIKTKIPKGFSYDTCFAKDKQEDLLNEFLTYCQVILTSIKLLNHYSFSINTKYGVYESDGKDIDRLLEIIESSLNCFNYKSYFKEDSLIVEIIVNDPVAETIASQTTIEISDAIYGYLSNRDLATKEKYLHDFIDLIELKINKYSDQATIKKIREFVQLIRHPETKKAETQYVWFFKNKKKYLDELFSLCLFVEQFDITKSIINRFEKNKKG